MCLGVPGQVLEVTPDALGMNMGRVSFGGIVKEVCLAYTPDVQPGEYVVVHVGFAISTIDEEEAGKVFALLEEMGDLQELDVPQPDEETARQLGPEASAPGEHGAGEPRGHGADSGDAAAGRQEP